MKITKYILFTVLAAGAVQAAPLSETNRSGQARSWTVVRDYLAKERRSGTPILVAECLKSNDREYDKEIVVFDVGKSSGQFWDFSWFKTDSQASAVLGDYADIRIGSSKSPRVKIDNVSQGGYYEVQQFQLDAEYMLHRGLRLLYPKDFNSLISSRAASCPKWDWDPVNPASIDEIYKNQKW